MPDRICRNDDVQKPPTFKIGDICPDVFHRAHFLHCSGGKRLVYTALVSTHSHTGCFFPSHGMAEESHSKQHFVVKHTLVAAAFKSYGGSSSWWFNSDGGFVSLHTIRF